MRTIHYLLFVVWASYCLAAPTPGRNAAARDVPTSSSASDINNEEKDMWVQVLCRHQTREIAERQSSVLIQLMEADLRDWARQRSDELQNRMMGLLPQQYELSEASLIASRDTLSQCLLGQTSGIDLKSLMPKTFARLEEFTNRKMAEEIFEEIQQSRQSNPHDSSRHDSTQTGSGSTSGRLRLSDQSSHGAGPSHGVSRRGRSRGKDLE
ncbi:hypothetical protein SeLEV6574_g07496 [Synchytrium endobioticum]|uniref:Uncharacterized protein n=1 Tax=Synchytrium endobioticum TaxID=286115 RepID=A0A507CHL8_9FUNG|nr:hypothetical protein SeLEV6574_g07496 [Synchytrium endobioticum]